MSRSPHLPLFAAALAPLFALACSSPSAVDDGGARDLSVSDAGCLETTPPTQLYEDPCVPGSTNGGATFCLIDHPPTDFF